YACIPPCCVASCIPHHKSTAQIFMKRTSTLLVNRKMIGAPAPCILLQSAIIPRFVWNSPCCLHSVTERIKTGFCVGNVAYPVHSASALKLMSGSLCIRQVQYQYCTRVRRCVQNVIKSVHFGTCVHMRLQI